MSIKSRLIVAFLMVSLLEAVAGGYLICCEYFWISRQQASVYVIQQSVVLLGLFFIFSVILLFAVCSYLISSITNPLSQLAKSLDEVQIESEFPSLKSPSSQVREVKVLFDCFERLFARLEGYRALNVKRLLHEKRRADVIATAISEGIFLLKGNEILYMNPVAEKILGLESGWRFNGSLLDASTANVPNPEGLRAVKWAVSRTLPVELEVDFQDRKSHFLLQSLPLSNNLIEQVEHSVGGSIDQFLDRFQADTMVLAQDVTLVRESQEAKSHFLATLSHEVKTPVTTLTMAIRLLNKGKDQIPNETHRNLITTSVENVDRLRRLLEDLLKISNFDILAQKLELQTVDLAKLLLHSVQSFQVEAHGKGVELEYVHTNPGVSIQLPLDASKVAWAISNLLTNALRHTPKGGKVSVEIHSDEEQVEVKIGDTGPGIDPARLERVFDKFNPYYDLRVARSGSVGAGLAIAREIIVAHGGRIWVMSEAGEGAEFCFSFPLKPQIPGFLKEISQGAKKLG